MYTYANDYRYYSSYAYNNYLMHYGVKGMKWGVRRYRNEDGTLTDAGKRHEQKQRTKSVKKQREFDRKNVEGLSDKELNARIERTKKEKEYRNLIRDNQVAGRNTAQRFLSSVGDATIRAGAAALVGAGVYALRAYVYSKHVEVKNPMTGEFEKWKMSSDDYKQLVDFALPNPNAKKK